MQINDFGKWSPIIEKIRHISNKYGLHAYIVGGWVRDKLLNREPKDLDIMVEGDGSGIKLSQLLYEEYGGHEPILFPRFGTSKLIIDNEDVEFVSPRKEVYYEGNRKPDTSVGSLYDDAIRRDFSVNALFVDVNNGKVLDLTGNGINDLNKKILRVADPENPDTIMEQDPLRLLRLIRQASQLNFSVDPITYDAVRRNVDKILTISKERVQEELNKMLLTDKPSRALIILKDSGLLSRILPELDTLESTEEEEGVNDSKNVWSHTLQVVDNAPKNLTVRLAALFHDMGKPATKSRTYKVTCPVCGEPINYVYKSQPDGSIVCQNGICDGWLKFKSEKELMQTFPEYDVHFYDHEKVGASKATKVLRELKYSEEIIKAVNTLITHHMKAHAYSDDWTDSAIRRYQLETHPHTQDLLDLTQSDITSKYPEKRQRGINRVNKLRERIQKVNEQMELAKIKSPLDGNELCQIYNKKPGEWIKHIKTFLLNEVIEGNLAPDDKEGAKRLLDTIDIDKLASDNSVVKLSWRDF